jgi:uncharacterized protein (DUF4415 family)
MAIRYEQARKAPEANPNRTGKPGRPKTGKAKELITLRLDPRVIAGFKAKGDGWQAKINAVLADYLRL